MATDTPDTQTAGTEVKAKAPAAAKKAKGPTVEDKPLGQFITEDFFPALRPLLAQQGLGDMELTFADNRIKGSWDQGDHQFVVHFLQGTLKGPKTFAYSSFGAAPSTLESFMIREEAKVTLDLMVLYVLQRLRAQKTVVLN
ncbi:MAG: DUF2996 domain-containing protein [Gloeomargaritaceae cyanobacterium C42_A2020_066]|nr:DUF2996 domain-containing protein [Gloeomargaritaceae cyanobacterium C42_A2020_066]